MTNSLNSAERTLGTGAPNDCFFFFLIPQGAPNDRFLLNALKTLFSVPRVLLDLQKCILSCAIKFVSVRLILGELESFRNYKGFSIIFPQILDAIQRITKVRIFLIPLSITYSAYLNPKILAFLFLTKNSLTWDVKC